MPDVIRDGSGKGFLAKVNSDNQLITRATTVQQRLASTIDNRYFEATTGKITLSDAVETGLFYIKNISTITSDVIVIDRVFVDIWSSTAGTGNDGDIKYYINPTVTGGSAATVTNTKFNSTTSLEATVLKSVTSIDTGTVWWTGYITDKQAMVIEEGRIVIPPGSSFAISITAPTSNTNMDISINVAMFVLDINLI